ncbi:MAG: hypothetical protein R2771_13600 [Saprospiraceae bacterium]
MFSQIDTIAPIPAEKISNLMYPDLVLNSRDSIFLDSISELFKLKNKLDSTIYSLNTSQQYN